MWERLIHCKFCKHSFTATDLAVQYADCRNPIFFQPDYQYFIECPECHEKLIRGDIPSDVAIEVQKRVHAENTSSES